jgi:hypothetical protein
MYDKEFVQTSTSYYSLIDRLGSSSSWNLIMGGSKLTKKATKHSDAVMTGILVTRFKMGQINIEDLEQMSTDPSKAERCSAAKKVLEAIRDSPDLPHRQEILSSPDTPFQTH